jgi:heptosyltransferase-2
VKEQLDGVVQIDYITKKPFASLLTSNPHIDEVITIDKSVSEVADRLRSGMYDYVIDLHNNIRSKQVKRLVKALSFTLDKRNVAKWVYVQTKRPMLPIGHVVQRSFDCIAPLGVMDDQRGLDFHFPSGPELQKAILPERFQSGFFAFAIGGQMKGKTLPPAHIIRICKGLRLPVVLLGGPEDRPAADAIKEALGDQVFNACGAFSLLESAVLIQRSERVLAHDTGLMHIAVALGKSLVSIWLATTPELGFAPWQPKAPSVMIEANCSKRPTSKLGNRGYQDGCVFNIAVNDVIAAANAPLD